MANKDDLLIKSVISKKDFSYQKGECSLGFTLKVDNSSELRDFRFCLEQAIKDIDEILEGMKN